MKWRRVSFVIGLLGILGNVLWACSLCFSAGRSSIIDEIQGAQTVVLARANPQKSEVVRVLKVLKGELSDKEQEIILERPIPEKILQEDILCVFKRSYWKSLGALEQETLPFIEYILEQKTSWSLNPEQHMDYIVEFLDHENDQLREFAFSELARAPYSRICSFAKSLSKQARNDLLKNPTISNWRALYILIIAHTGDEAHEETIRKQLFLLSKSKENDQLAPWTAALIELDQEKAFPVIRECYLEREITYIEMDAIVHALSTHANDGHKHLRPQIVQLYQELINKSNRSSINMIKDLHKWGETEIAKQLLEQTSTSYTMWQRKELQDFLKTPVVEDENSQDEISSVSPETTPSGSPKSGLLFFALLILLPLAFQLYRFCKKRSAST